MVVIEADDATKPVTAAWFAVNVHVPVLPVIVNVWV
jgi:hypothetical protein